MPDVSQVSNHSTRRRYGSPDNMGEIRVRIYLQNTVDLIQAREKKDQRIRSHEMEAVVDTGAVLLFLPQDVVEQLGLPTVRRATVTYADERKDVRDMAGPVTIEILGRGMEANCIVGPPGSEAHVGQIQLEQMDLIADSLNRSVYPREDSPYPTLKIK